MYFGAGLWAPLKGLLISPATVELISLIWQSGLSTAGYRSVGDLRDPLRSGIGDAIRVLVTSDLPRLHTYNCTYIVGTQAAQCKPQAQPAFPQQHVTQVGRYLHLGD